MQSLVTLQQVEYTVTTGLEKTKTAATNLYSESNKPNSYPSNIYFNIIPNQGKELNYQNLT
jgi:hypothetical protein